MLTGNRKANRGRVAHARKHNRDKAKKEFNVNNAKELKLLSEKYKRREDGRSIKPNFFAAKDRGKGYYDTDKKNYAKHDTTMDYLQTAVNSFRMHQSRGHKREFIPFSELVCDDGYNHRNVWMPKVDRIIALVRSSMNDIHNIYNAPELSDDEKFELAAARRQDAIDYIGGVVMTRNTMIYMLKHLEEEGYRDIYRAIFNTLFGYPNTEFYALIKHSADVVHSLEPDSDGDVELYGMHFRNV